jgi:hypothetical protein
VAFSITGKQNEGKTGSTVLLGIRRSILVGRNRRRLRKVGSAQDYNLEPHGSLAIGTDTQREKEDGLPELDQESIDGRMIGKAAALGGLDPDLPLRDESDTLAVVPLVRRELYDDSYVGANELERHRRAGYGILGAVGLPPLDLGLGLVVGAARTRLGLTIWSNTLICRRGRYHGVDSDDEGFIPQCVGYSLGVGNTLGAECSR